MVNAEDIRLTELLRWLESMVNYEGWDVAAVLDGIAALRELQSLSSS